MTSSASALRSILVEWLVQTFLVWTSWGLVWWKYDWEVSFFFGLGAFCPFGLLYGFGFKNRKREFLGLSGMMASLIAGLFSFFIGWPMEMGERMPAELRAGGIMLLVVLMGGWALFSVYGMRKFPTRVAAPTDAPNNREI